MDAATLQSMIFWAGTAELTLAAGSTAIPFVLDWPGQTARWRPLIRQVFWTYAAYILTAHFCFGTLSVAAPHLLTDGTPLARLVCGFIAAWWAARLPIQFFWFDRHDAPAGWVTFLGEIVLVALFVGLAGVYGFVAAATGRATP